MSNLINKNMSNTTTQLVNASDLALVESSAFNPKQLALLLKKTPEKYVRQRPAKGGGQWAYVTGGYVRKVLNLMFGFDWDFEIINETIADGEAIVKGKLTIRSNGKVITKMQFGNKEVMYRKQTPQEIEKGAEKVPLSRGNDLKAAATDALKKCAAEIGIAADIYNAAEFREMNIRVEETKPLLIEELTELFNLKYDQIDKEDLPNFQRIIANQETDKYQSVFNHLKSL